MKALFYVSNNPALLPDLLKKLKSSGIKGGTIFDTDGMGRELSKAGDDEFSTMFCGLRSLLKPNLVNNKTLMLVLDEQRIPPVVEIIESVVGNLDLPETGILFTINLEYTKGIKL